jgi:hypothetical protein
MTSRSKEHNIPPLIITVLRAVNHEAQHHPTSYAVGHAYLTLEAHPDAIDQAIECAHLSGLLSVVGKPPHSVTITPIGRRLLEIVT